jgi:pantoate--beta-alanine ligase
MTTVVRTGAQLQQFYASFDGSAATDRRHRAVVMTMGALHDGHAALMEAARHVVGADGVVVVTVFVNPRQFLPHEDLDRYPRTLDADVALCCEHDVNVVLAPDVDEVYGVDVPTIQAGPLGLELEGRERPGHFDGVLTVVHRLLQMVDAGIAVFGEKDYQQLVLISQMVRDRDLPVTVVAVPTVRDQNGLALSSRNTYLDEPQRMQALALSSALAAGVAVADGASPDDAVESIENAARNAFAAAAVTPDYIAVTDNDLNPMRPGVTGSARLLVAARIGSTRLIDNSGLHIGQRP